MRKTFLLALTLGTLCLLSACDKEEAPVKPQPGEAVVMTEQMIDEHPKSDFITVEDERITITSLAVWEEFNHDGNFSDNCLNFLRNFIENDSEYLEFNSVKVSNWEIIRDPELYGRDLAFNFTITASAIDALPIGTYETVITDTVDCAMDFLVSPRKQTEVAISASTAVEVINDWIYFSQYYDFAAYGTWDGVQFTHYLTCRYRGEPGAGMLYADFAALAKDKFGAEVNTDQFPYQLYVEDNSLYIFSEGGDRNPAFDIVEVTKEDHVSTVVVQFYGDYNKFLKSYRMAYHIDDEERLLDCEIIENSPYKPYGLRSVK